MSTLESRAVAALSSNIASVDLAILIDETEDAIIAADAAAAEACANALDAVASPDPVVALAARDNATFACARLRNLLPRLQARLQQVQAEEYAAQWEPDFKQVEAERDELAEKFEKVYSAAVAQLVPLLQRMAACDRECGRINSSAPPGEHRRLLGVELTARRVEGLLRPDVEITGELRLPAFNRGDGPVLAWPSSALTPPPKARQYAIETVQRAGARAAAAAMTPLTPAQIAARNAAQIAEQVAAQYRSADHLAERERQRLERDEKERCEAMERNIAERRQRQSWFGRPPAINGYGANGHGAEEGWA